MKNLLIVVAFFAIGAIQAQTTTTLAPETSIDETAYDKCVKKCKAEFPTQDGASQVECIRGCAITNPQSTTPALPKPKSKAQAPKPGTVKGQ